MSTLNVQLRKDCMVKALQMWLDSMQPGLKVVDILAPNPPEITITVDDGEPEQREAA